MSPRSAALRSEEQPPPLQDVLAEGGPLHGEALYAITYLAGSATSYRRLGDRWARYFRAEGSNVAVFLGWSQRDGNGGWKDVV